MMTMNLTDKETLQKFSNTLAQRISEEYNTQVQIRLQELDGGEKFPFLVRVLITQGMNVIQAFELWKCHSQDQMFWG